MAKELEVSPRTLVEWKKNRVTLYKRLKWSYKAEQLLKEIESSNDDIQVKVKELLQDS